VGRVEPVEILTLIALLVGVSWFVLTLIEEEESTGPLLRVRAATLGRKASRALLDAGRRLRDRWARMRSSAGSRLEIGEWARPRRMTRAVPASGRGSFRLRALLELLLLVILIGAVVAGAVAGAAWGMGRLLLD
jgi:hypothetical protein